MSINFSEISVSRIIKTSKVYKSYFSERTFPAAVADVGVGCLMICRTMCMIVSNDNSLTALIMLTRIN